MKILLFCVRDVKLGEFNSPMVFPSRGIAQRSFQDEVNRDAPDNAVYRYPSDFSLYYVGEFDSTSGVLIPVEVPELVAQAADLKV